MSTAAATGTDAADDSGSGEKRIKLKIKLKPPVEPEMDDSNFTMRENAPLEQKTETAAEAKVDQKRRRGRPARKSTTKQQQQQGAKIMSPSRANNEEILDEDSSQSIVTPSNGHKTKKRKTIKQENQEANHFPAETSTLESAISQQRARLSELLAKKEAKLKELLFLEQGGNLLDFDSSVPLSISPEIRFPQSSELHAGISTQTNFMFSQPPPQTKVFL